MNAIRAMSKIIDIKLATKCFWAYSLIVVLLIPVDWFIVQYGRSPKSPATTINTTDFGLKPRNKEVVLEALGRSTVFGSPASTGSSQIPSISLQEMTKDYRLIGVVITDTPEAILENVQTRKTEFVEVGFVVGDMTVKAITEGEIVLSYLGQDTSLQIK